MNYMGHTQPPRNNLFVQQAIEQGGYLAPPETKLRFEVRLTDSLNNSDTSLLSTQNFSPMRQGNSALPSISPHQPTFAHVPLRFLEQLKAPLNIREEERSGAQKELEKRHASPKLIVLMRFLEKHGGPQNIPQNAISPLQEISLEALRGRYGEQLWGLRNLFHVAPNFLLACQNLENLIKKALSKPGKTQTSRPLFQTLPLALFYEELTLPALVKKLLKTTEEKPSAVHFALCLLLLSLSECQKELPSSFKALQGLDELLSPFLFEEKKALNSHGLLLITAFVGAKELLFFWLSDSMGETEEPSKKPILGALSATFASAQTQLLYEIILRAPEDKHSSLKMTALVAGLYSLLSGADYFEELDATFLQRCVPIEQAALFENQAAQNPDLKFALRRCSERSERSSSSKELIEKLSPLLIPLLDIEEESTLKQYSEDAGALAKKLTALYEIT